VETDKQDAKVVLLFRLLFMGFLLMFVGVVVLVIAAWLGGDSSVSGGVIIIVGFVPIVVGAGPYAFSTILMAAILMVIAFVVFVWVRKKSQGARG